MDGPGITITVGIAAFTGLGALVLKRPQRFVEMAPALALLLFATTVGSFAWMLGYIVGSSDAQLLIAKTDRVAISVEITEALMAARPPWWPAICSSVALIVLLAMWMVAYFEIVDRRSAALGESTTRKR